MDLQQVIIKLKNPNLVSSFQQYFGVRLLDTEKIDKYSKRPQFVVENKFWFWLFYFGTLLGDEVFYAVFIPSWFWNVDGAVGRRVVLVWAIVMYIGQALKDIIKWPRPGPPVVQLQDKWSLEYGMPSTHAMVSISIPFSVLVYTMDRYEYPVYYGFLTAVLWTTLVCLSRLYLGMHSVLDVIVGVLLSFLIMFPLVPLVDKFDHFLLTDPKSPIILLTVGLLMLFYYPHGDKWTPTRGDTTMMVSVCIGIQIGAWMNYQLGTMSQPELTPPYTIFWPSYSKLGQCCLRTCLGFVSIGVTRFITKWLTYSTLCTFLRVNPDDLKQSADTLENKHKTFVDLTYKFISCSIIGFNILCSLPILFRYLGIERPTFYTEI